jgi:ATP-binding cassette subfamily E protein 1
LTTSPRYYEQSVLIKLAVTLILQGLSGVVGALLKAKDEMNRLVHIQDTLELNHILDRNISDLSGGELQRFAIGIIRSVMLAQPVFLAITSLSLQRAEGRRVHVRRAFFLPRCQAAPQSQVSSSISGSRVIRSLLDSSNFVIVVEHDLSVIDYLSDFICVLYGVPGA